MPMAVKSDSNHITIVYYCNTIAIVNDIPKEMLFTFIYYRIGHSSTHSTTNLQAAINTIKWFGRYPVIFSVYWIGNPVIFQS